MDLPDTDTLPSKLFLLALNPERERLTGRHNLDLLLGAAVLTELFQRGLLRDERGRAVATGPAPADLDPLLAEALQRIRDARLRPWRAWMTSRRHTARAVREQLAADGRIRVAEHRVLGLFPARRITCRDPRPRKALLTAVSGALRGPLGRVTPADAALVALADAGQLRIVVDYRVRRAHRRRLAELAARCGPLPLALRRAIRARDAVASF
ncbi:GPP34 family phosphoprotein [Kitasatospora sp. NPDC052896]|uniref:GOLPH3/VPS74 family protein n=1 Tax=Kitasatospora sp. NPDC052896 TaxID=3364061 RepID=UPI0037C5CB20